VAIDPEEHPSQPNEGLMTQEGSPAEASQEDPLPHDEQLAPRDQQDAWKIEQKAPRDTC
jgi:hypothetical protein